jgi:hypothetical protein
MKWQIILFSVGILEKAFGAAKREASQMQIKVS